MFDPEPKRDTLNVSDQATIQMILDSRDHNDESLRILDKAIFPSDTPIEQLDIDDSIILKLVYQRKK